MTHFASRLAGIEPFQVMDILARARALEAQGRSIIHMEIGEPDFPAAPGIVEAGIAALKAGHTHYTPALGLPALRAAIAANYASACRVSAARVVVTPGASGALQLVLAALLDPGDRVLMADPGYPCNRHFVRLFEGAAVSIAVGPETHYQLNAELIRERWTPTTPGTEGGRATPGAVAENRGGVAGLAIEPHRHAGAAGGDGAHRRDRARAGWCIDRG